MGVGRYGTDHMKRVVVAAFAWPANLQADAVYLYTTIDARGEKVTLPCLQWLPPVGLSPRYHYRESEIIVVARLRSAACLHAGAVPPEMLGAVRACV